MAWRTRHVTLNRLISAEIKLSRSDDDKHTSGSQVLVNCPPLEEWRKFLYVHMPVYQHALLAYSFNPPPLYTYTPRTYNSTYICSCTHARRSYCEGALGGSVLGSVDHFPHHHGSGRRDCGRHAGGGMDGHSPTGVSHVSQRCLSFLC